MNDGAFAFAGSADVRVALNATVAPYPDDATIHGLFEQQVRRTPDAIALACGAETLTYAELNRRANLLADTFIELGVTTDDLVAICLERSAALVTALIAVLKAGGAYLPLDPTYPRDRLAFMLADTAAPVLVTERRLAAALPPGPGRVVLMDDQSWLAAPERERDPHPRGAPDDLAYVNYTSGSTGRPKGVLIPHRAVTRLLFSANYVKLDQRCRVLQLAPISFDAATFELWGPLLHGGVCALFEGKIPTLQKLHAAIARHGITTLFLTTALFNTIVDEAPEMLGGVKQVLTGGEAHSVPHMRKALAALPATEIVSVYGPTETTTFATYQPVHAVGEGAATVPIGRPIANTTVYVLDTQLRPAAVGAVGELYIGGPGLARGYLNQPALTAERFVRNLSFLPGKERLYRTGDLARYLPDGTIDFVGRIDHQVKLHGFRVELGEIEARLLLHPRVRQAAVVVKERSHDDRRLVAYLVGEGGVADSDSVRDHLAAQLPKYMVPTVLRWVEALPLTPNGKVDRAGLAARA